MPNYRVVLKDPSREASQLEGGYLKPISSISATKQKARKQAKDFCSKDCTVEIYETREVLIETVSLCDQCKGSGRTCHKCGAVAAACNCVGGFDPVVCLGCSGNGVITLDSSER